MLRRAKSFIHRKKHEEKELPLPESSHLKRQDSINSKSIKQQRTVNNAKKEEVNKGKALSKQHSRSQENLLQIRRRDRSEIKAPSTKYKALEQCLVITKKPQPKTVHEVKTLKISGIKSPIQPDFNKSWPHEGKSDNSGMIIRSNPLYRSEKSVLKRPPQITKGTIAQSHTIEPPWKPPDTVQELVTSLNHLYLEEEKSHNSEKCSTSGKLKPMRVPKEDKKFYQTEF